MSTMINFSELKRIPESADIDKAKQLLEDNLSMIIAKHQDFFTANNSPKGIDYLISPVIKSNGGVIELPYPELLFIDSSLPIQIRQEVAIEFYKHLFQVING